MEHPLPPRRGPVQDLLRLGVLPARLPRHARPCGGGKHRDACPGTATRALSRARQRGAAPGCGSSMARSRRSMRPASTPRTGSGRAGTKKKSLRCGRVPGHRRGPIWRRRRSISRSSTVDRTGRRRSPRGSAPSPCRVGTLRLGGAGEVTALAGYAEGTWWVQDAAAALPCPPARPARGQARAGDRRRTRRQDRPARRRRRARHPPWTAPRRASPGSGRTWRGSGWWPRSSRPTPWRGSPPRPPRSCSSMRPARRPGPSGATPTSRMAAARPTWPVWPRRSAGCSPARGRDGGAGGTPGQRELLAAAGGMRRPGGGLSRGRAGGFARLPVRGDELPGLGEAVTPRRRRAQPALPLAGRRPAWTASMWRACSAMPKQVPDAAMQQAPPDCSVHPGRGTFPASARRSARFRVPAPTGCTST